MSPDERILAIADSRTSTIRIWEMESRRQIMHLIAGGALAKLDFSPDGSILAAVRIGSNKAKLWDLKNKREKPMLEANYSLTLFSPSGLLLAIDRYHIKFLDARTLKEIATFENGQISGFPQAAFSPDGSMLALTLGNHSIGIYRVKTSAVTTVDK